MYNKIKDKINKLNNEANIISGVQDNSIHKIPQIKTTSYGAGYTNQPTLSLAL